MNEPTTQPSPPIVCDMTEASDTAVERIAEYARLFTEALIEKERTPNGIRFRFRGTGEVAEWVSDLASREQACCAFFSFAVETHGDEVWWDTSVPDDDIARQVLEQFFDLPELVTQGTAEVHRQFTASGLAVLIDDGGVRRPASARDLGVDPSQGSAEP